MFRRSIIALLLAAGLLTGVACKKHQKAANPLEQVDSKQPDKVLYDRAMTLMKQHKYDTVRITLQTLINAYPDSEYVARAKLGVGEAWYEEGTAAGLAQAESEFRDFITFFPNMPEAAEAQLKIANIHYQQMAKPDRDATHARRAQDEYRLLLQQYPDSKLADTARLRLLEVQELLAEREFRVAHFYFGRGSYLAAIARAKTLTDTYPLYSHADEAYFILGQACELQGERIRASNMPAAGKQRLVAEYEESAAGAYSRIITRYPAMARVDDARHRLAALKRPIPTPTAEAIALNKSELASRTSKTRYEGFLNSMGKHPDLSAATRVGQPTMVDPKETDAPYLVREINAAMIPGAATATATATTPSGSGAVQLEGIDGAKTQPTPVAKVNPTDVPTEAPAQLNEADQGGGESSSAATAGESPTTASAQAPNGKDDASQASSSRKDKKKHRLHLGLPF